MRVLFAVSKWPTHYLSMIPLGWAVQAAGHELRVACDPAESATVTGAGLIAAPVLAGMDVPVATRLQNYLAARDGFWRYPWLPTHPLTGAPLSDLAGFDLARYEAEIAPGYRARAVRSFDAAVALARQWRPDVVVHDPVCLEGALAAAATGVASALFLWGPTGTHEAEYLRVLPREESGSFARYGLPDHSPDSVEQVIDGCPAAVAPPVTARRLPYGFVPYNGSGTVPGWLAEPPRRRRVCVVWSTAVTRVVGPQANLLPRLVQALAGLDIELLLTATPEDVAALGPVPDNVRVLERFPLRLVVQTCDLIVHHGGAGTSMTSMWAGVPQLAITFAAEQHVNADRISVAGAMIHLPGEQAEVQAIRAAATELLDGPEYRHTAQGLAKDMAARPTPAEFVNVLQELAIR